ncbi:hypothetical protein OsJ_29315 [Oryza sativa Japonica Group]|uniref:Uncharacterized protein n=1 Tax=Oryza sativa subsp. japonica TaxID=39947 RepID=B9G3I2_ORYSJ|nr:hypothetical protein OsJ_29315 [Oryza sativa Japonica Group]
MAKRHHNYARRQEGLASIREQNESSKSCQCNRRSKSMDLSSYGYPTPRNLGSEVVQKGS